jgi:hypothetical protein
VKAWTNDVSQYTQEYSVYQMDSVAFKSWAVAVEWYNSIIRSLIFKESYILYYNCVLRNNIHYFVFISNFSGFVNINK